MIYTTNSVEGYHRQLRKVIKNKFSFLLSKISLDSISLDSNFLLIYNSSQTGQTGQTGLTTQTSHINKLLKKFGMVRRAIINIINEQVRVSDAKAQRLLVLIENGTFKVGDRLAGQRDMAKIMDIGRSSLREAIRYLEILGVLETRPGLGTFVISDKPKSFDTPLDRWLIENRDDVYMVFEAREAVETKAAELASKRAKQDDIKALRDILNKMEIAIKNDDFEEITHQDIAFHNAISKASNNEFLCQIVDSIQDALMKSRQAVLILPGRACRSLKEHHEILTAIQNSDSRAAREAMKKHLEFAVQDVASLEICEDNPAV